MNNMDWATGKPEENGTPIGTFNCMIQSCVEKTTKAGDGKYANFNFVVLDGDKEGRSVYFMANFENKNPTTEHIAKNQVNKIMQILGMDAFPGTWEGFVGGKLQVTTKPGKKEGDVYFYFNALEAGAAQNTGSAF